MKTLREYEDMGLIYTAGRSPGNYVCRKPSSVNSDQASLEYSWSKRPSRSWRKIPPPVREVQAEE